MLEVIKEHMLEFILTAITSGIALYAKTLYTKVYNRIKTESEEQACLKAGLVALLHNSLYRNCEEYISRNQITVDELNNLEYLYNSYHALGGNGTGTELYNRCKALRIVVE